MSYGSYGAYGVSGGALVAAVLGMIVAKSNLFIVVMILMTLSGLTSLIFLYAGSYLIFIDVNSKAMLDARCNGNFLEENFFAKNMISTYQEAYSSQLAEFACEKDCKCTYVDKNLWGDREYLLAEKEIGTGTEKVFKTCYETLRQSPNTDGTDKIE